MASVAPEVAAYILDYRTGASVQNLTMLDQATGKVIQSTIQLSTTEEKANQTTRVRADTMDKLLARYNPVIKVEQERERVLKQLNRAEQEGRGDTEKRAQIISFLDEKMRRANESLTLQEAQMRKSATATGLARYELINLSRQIQDVGVSLAGGQSPFRILVEQGSQIADIFISSKATVTDFFKGIGASIAGLGGRAAAIAVGGVATALVVGAGAAALAWASAQKDVELALLGIGRASGATANSIDNIAKAGASTFGLSISEAREFASILAQTGQIGVNQLGPMVELGKNLAIVLGTSSAEAAKVLGKALAEPGKGIETLNQALGQFDAATVRLVQNLVEQNKLLEAQKIIMEGVAQATKNAQDAVSNTSAFWTALGNVISNAANAVGEYVAKTSGLGASTEQQLALLIEEYQRIQQKLASPFSDKAFQNAELDKVLTQIGLLNAALERVGGVAEDTRNKLRSMADQKLVRDISPEIRQFEVLSNRAEGLRTLLQRIQATGGAQSPILEGLRQTMEQVNLSARRANEALASALAPAARLTAEFEIGNLQITARTQQQRVLLAGLQAELALAGQNVSEEEKALAVERARYQAVLQIAQGHKDSMAALQDQLNVVQAVTQQDKLDAQYQADINAGRNAGLSLMQAEEQAAMKLAIAEAQIAEQKRQQNRQMEEANRRRLESTQAVLQIEQQISGQRTEQISMGGKEGGTVGGTGGGGGSKGPSTGLFFGTRVAIPPWYNPLAFGRVGEPQTRDPVVVKLLQDQVDKIAASQPGSEQFIRAQEEAAQKQLEAAEQQKQAAEDQVEAAKAAREAQISALDEAVKDIVATKLLAGQTAQAVNVMIEQGAIQFGTASTRFQTQLDLYKRAGASNSQIAADIRAGVIGEGARPSELLAALDSLTNAVDSNTAAQIGLSDFYTQQGDRLLGYRGYSVQTGIRSPIGANAPGIPGAGTGTGAIGGMGGVVNPPGQVAAEFQGGIGSTGSIYPEGTIIVRLIGSEYITYTLTNGLWVETRRTPRTGPTSSWGSYAEGGIVDRPQIAMAGEAGPEAFVPLKGGAIPVKLIGAANNNQPATIVNINAPLVNFMAEPTRDEVRESAFQASQMLRRVAFGG